MLSPRIRCYFCFVLFLKNRKNTHYFAIGSKSFFLKLVFFFQSTPSKSIFLLHKGSNQSFSLTEKTLSNLLEDAYFIHTGLFSTTMVFRQGLLFKKSHLQPSRRAAQQLIEAIVLGQAQRHKSLDKCQNISYT